MTAVIAEGPAEHAPDLWRDRAATIGRAGERGDRLPVDDSKRLHAGPRGRERLETTALCALAEVAAGSCPETLAQWLDCCGAGSLADVELERWVPAGGLAPLPAPEMHAGLARQLAARPFQGAPWRLAAILMEVVAPARFQRELSQATTKAEVHFAAFGRLLTRVAARDPAVAATRVVSDRHGGRQFYLDGLAGLFPGAWIDRGIESPAESAYRVRTGEGTIAVRFRPRADAEDGLVALASVVAKAFRERWMDVFNAFWMERVPGLRPTAGYPVDARRFRAQIEGRARELGIPASCWWRER
jgi:hypothetical protein